MKTIAIAILTMMTVVMLAGQVASEKDNDDADKVSTKTGIVIGIVIDIPCYIMKHGHGHSVCALDQGLPVGLVDAEGNIWIAINDKYAAANKLLAPLMGQRVKAEGWYVEADPYRLISISKVTSLEKGSKRDTE